MSEEERGDLSGWSGMSQNPQRGREKQVGTEGWEFYSKFMDESLGRLLMGWAKVLSALWGWIRGYGTAGSPSGV